MQSLFHFFLDILGTMGTIGTMGTDGTATQIENGFGERLKAYRLDRLWTLHQMATVTGLSISGLQSIENGKVQPHDLTVAKILKALPDLSA